MDSSDVFSQLQAQIAEMHQREIANCEEINQLTHENLELIKEAAQAKAYKKQIDILLSDPMLVKMRVSNSDDMEIENSSQNDERYQNLLQKLKEVSAERDKYAQIVAEQSYYQDQIAKKNNQIIELTDKLTTTQNSADIYKKQLEDIRSSEHPVHEEDTASKDRIIQLEQENRKLQELLKDKANEIGSINAFNTELEMKNREINKRLSDAQTMITVQQTESRMISDPLFNKEDLARRIRQACDTVLGNADEILEGMEKKIKVLEKKVESFKNATSSEEFEEQQEIIEDLNEQIRYLEENDAAPKLASALKKITDLENQVAWLQNKN